MMADAALIEKDWRDVPREGNGRLGTGGVGDPYRYDNHERDGHALAHSAIMQAIR